MAATLAQLQAQLDALQKARASGVLMARHENSSNTFRSLAEMDQIIASLQRQIAGFSTGLRVRAVRILTRDQF